MGTPQPHYSLKLFGDWKRHAKLRAWPVLDEW